MKEECQTEGGRKEFEKLARFAAIGRVKLQDVEPRLVGNLQTSLARDEQIDMSFKLPPQKCPKCGNSNENLFDERMNELGNHHMTCLVCGRKWFYTNDMLQGTAPMEPIYED